MTFINVKQQPQQSINKWVDHLFKDMSSIYHDDFNNAGVKHFIPVNVKEDENQFVLEVVAPGFDKEAFKIDLDKNILSISAEVKPNEEKKEKNIRSEYRFQSFKRSFTVSKNIDTQNIEAKYANGILTVSLPKKVEVKEPVKRITIQ